MATVQKGREQLQAVVEPLPHELHDDLAAAEAIYVDDNAVFDQDDH